MGLSVEAVAVAKKYTDNSIKGISGTLAGKNCTIKSIIKTDGVNVTTFEWTANDGTTKTNQMQVKDGKDGIGIETINKLATLGLLDTYQILYTDGTTQNYTITNGKDGISVVGVIQLTDDSFAFELSDGTQTDPLIIPNSKIEISKESGNILEKKTDGLYVGSTGIEISQEEDNAIKTKTDGLYVKDLEETVSDNVADILSIDGRVTNIESDIEEKVDKETNKSLVLDTDILQITTNKNNIDTLNGTGEGSVSKKIGDAISSLTYLTKKIATQTEIDGYIADPTTASFNVIYLLKVDSVTGDDKYKEYQRIGDATTSTFECTGDTSTNLADYAKTSDVILKEQKTEDAEKTLVVGADGNLELNDTIYTKKSDFDTLSEKVTDIELFKFPNAIIHGEPIINNGQISSFSTSNYLVLPSVFDLNGRGFEFKLAFTTNSDVTTAQNILGSKFCMALFVQNGKLNLRVSSNGTSWDIVTLEGSATIEANKTYYAKINFTRLNYVLSLSTDDETYNEIASKNVGDISPYPSELYIGVGNNFHNPFLGIINLNKCYLKVNTSIIWQGMDDAGLSTRLATDLDNIDDEGISKIKEISNENIKTSFDASPSDTNVPSEKLVKNSLDEKVDIQQDVTEKGKALIVGDDGNLELGYAEADLTEVNEKFEENSDWLKGKNLYADTNELTYSGNDNVYVGGADFYLPIGEYIFSAENNYSKAITFWFRESSPVDDNINHEVAVGDKTSFVFNVTASGLPISIGGRASDRSALTVPNVLKNIMVRKSSETDDTYEPYRGKSNLELAEEISRKELELAELKMLGWNVSKGCPIQNTVSGNLFTQRVGRVSLFDKTWTADGIGVGGVNVFRFEIPTNCKTYSNSAKWNIYVDGYKTLPLVLGYVNDVASTDKAVGGRSAGGNYIEFSTKTYSTVTDFKNYIETSGLYLYYELATPITRQIDGNENSNMVSSKLERFVAPSTDAELLALPNGIYSINVADVGTSLFPNPWGTLVVLKSGFVYGTMLYIGANAKMYFRNINNGAWREANWTALN